MFKRWLAAAVVLGLVSSVSGCTSTDLTGKVAPQFSLASLAGPEVSLSQFQGRPVMLNFWQLGCPPCIEELPFIQQVVTAGSQTVVLTISLGNSAGQLRSFMTANAYTFPVLLDLKGEVGTAFGIRYTPTTVFIDKNGQIVRTMVGAFSSYSDLAKALNRPG